LDETVRSLIIIGNGFDASLGLKSNFNDFFKTITTQSDSTQVFLTNKSKIDYVATKHLQSPGFAVINSGRQKNSLLTRETIKKLGGDNKRLYLDDYSSESQSSLSELSASAQGFWANYFDFQSKKPEYWYDVEKILGDFFKRKLKRVRTLTNLRISKNSTDNQMTQFEGISDYIRIMRNVVNSVGKNNGFFYDLSDASQTDIITQKLTYLLINVYGFNPQNGNLNEDLSEYLLQQLKIFEQHFATYLTQKLAEDSDYKKDAAERLEKLSDQPFNLLNFNYTKPQSDNLQFPRNIHSTLDNAPIFGIDSDDIEATKPYYKFTKTYRIMRLAGNTDTPQILPKSINKLIFYGHSLSQADYSYFQAIFDYYNIYSENIQLIFYYSPYGNKTSDEVARDQFDRVSRLLESYGDKIPNKGKNLLPKLLLEGRVKILELNLDQEP